MGQVIITNPSALVNAPEILRMNYATAYANLAKLKEGQLIELTDYRQAVFIKKTANKFTRVNSTGAFVADTVYNNTLLTTSDVLVLSKTIPANHYSFDTLGSLSASVTLETTYLTAGATRNLKFYINNQLIVPTVGATVSASSASSTTTKNSTLSASVTFKSLSGSDNAFFNTANAAYYTIDATQPLLCEVYSSTSSALDTSTTCLRSNITITS